MRRGGDEELTVEGGIEASQVSIRASWPSSSGIVEMERDGERWGCQRKDSIRTGRATVASEKDDKMSETMINDKNLPNPHLFEPLFYSRA